MRALRLGCGAVVLLLATYAVAAPQQAPDLRRAVPNDVFLVVYGKHNPERDFQREYYKEVWKTAQDSKIVERAAKIVTSRLSPDDVAKAKAVLAEIETAAAPIKLEELADAKEVVYAQRMIYSTGEVKMPVSQHLLLLRLTPEAAAHTQEGIKNLFGLVEKYSEGKVPAKSSVEGDVTIVSLGVPPQVPFQPTVMRLGDVLLICSSDEMARQSLKMLTGGEGASKFDDPRLKEAMRHLPEPEDGLVFYDGRQQFSELRKMGDFIRSVSHGDAKAARVAGLVDLLMDECAILDYAVSVDYTEGNLNRTAELGKLMPGAEKKTLAKMLDSGKPFTDWQAWVPADALSYSLSTGVNLHPLYERVMAVIKERFPEAEQGLAKFEQIQSQIDFHLDADLLQAFSGERISISLPSGTPRGQQSVLALRCEKPDRIRELLHRLVDTLSKQPAVAMQQLRLTKSQELDGFDEVSVALLAAQGVKPVVGFREGWMYVGSNAAAVKKVLDNKAGASQKVSESKAFQQFHLKVEGPVDSISYTNLAESTRQTASILTQIGTMGPMVLAMAGAQAKPEDLKPVQEALGLLPSIAKIVSKFDFLEARLSVTQAGSEPGTYHRQSVTVVRPAAGK